MSTILIIASVLALAGLGYFVIKEDIRQLHQFRADIRPGECVKIRTEAGFVHARVLRRESSLAVTVIETHNRKRHLIPLTFIYRP